MTLWARVSAEGLQFKEWGEDTVSVVFDPIGGDTHLIEPFARELLLHINDSAQTTPSLVSALGPLIDDVSQSDLGALIDSCLSRLENAGLIKRVPN